MKKILLISLSILYPACLKTSYATYEMTPEEYALAVKIEAHTTMNGFLDKLSKITPSESDHFERQKNAIIQEIRTILYRSNKNQKAFTTFVRSLNSFLNTNQIFSNATLYAIDISKLGLLLNYINTSVPIIEKQEEKNQQILEQQRVADVRKTQLTKLALDASVIGIGYSCKMITSECSIQ